MNVRVCHGTMTPSVTNVVIKSGLSWSVSVGIG